ncbi:MAG: DUF1476 domain-containing protein [Rickettsiales bacterium]|jgi:hypothetical protein|nr:DUF1476 domain-containing protein [Rickettsiales bacterium]
MTNLKDREKAHETKFAKDEELNFKANARRNKLLGLWAAEKLGKTGAEADAYAKDVVMADFETDGDSDVVFKIIKDFANDGQEISEQEIRTEMNRLLPIARDQVMADKK